MPRFTIRCPFAAALAIAAGAQGQAVPPGFEVTTYASGFEDPVGIVLAGDGRMFVAEQRGMVWVVQDGKVLPQPFIDLRAEVNGPWDRGLLGIALDPDFLANRRVYLLYTVDPVFGEPDERPEDGTYSRLTRYTGTARSNGNVADLGSRLVLIGATVAEGIPVCEPSHTIGSVRFAHDGTLFLSAGDGAHFDDVDAGGLDPDCFGPGMFPKQEDVGAFRAQYLDSLAGKILRIDPATGLGLPDNPHWTGNASDNRSRVWVNGLRNPFRVQVKPGSPPPGTLYIGDVGWFLFEEINVAFGGENLGWPCREGKDAAPGYPETAPSHSGCDTIETPQNPGPLTDPVITWHHSNPSLSTPPGFTGQTAVGGVYYEGPCYPAPFQCVHFLADYLQQWIKALEVDENDDFVALHDFATGAGNVVDMATDPFNGDIFYVAIHQGQVRRISFDAEVPGDVSGDCVVNIVDLLALLGAWGPNPGHPADLNDDGVVNILDLLLLLGLWT